MSELEGKTQVSNDFIKESVAQAKETFRTLHLDEELHNVILAAGEFYVEFRHSENLSEKLVVKKYLKEPDKFEETPFARFYPDKNSPIFIYVKPKKDGEETQSFIQLSCYSPISMVACYRKEAYEKELKSLIEQGYELKSGCWKHYPVENCGCQISDLDKLKSDLFFTEAYGKPKR